MASTNKCTYCGKEFAKARTLQVHLCEPKRRYLQRDEKWVVNAFMVSVFVTNATVIFVSST